MKTNGIQPNFTGKFAVSVTETLLSRVKNNQSEFFRLVDKIEYIKKITDKDTVIMMDKNKGMTPYIYLKNNRLGVVSNNISYNLDSALSPAFAKVSEISMLNIFMRKNLSLNQLSEAVREFPRHDIKLNGKTPEQIISDGIAAKIDIKG